MQFRLSGEYAPHHNGTERESDFQGHLQGSSFKKGLPADPLCAGHTSAVQTDKEYTDVSGSTQGGVLSFLGCLGHMYAKYL